MFTDEIYDTSKYSFLYSWYYYYPLNLKNSTQYTFSASSNSAYGNSANLYMVIRKTTDGSSYSDVAWIAHETNESLCRTLGSFSTDATSKYYLAVGQSSHDFATVVPNMKLEEGSTATAFSPYAKVVEYTSTYGTLPDLTESRTGYSFDGWFTAANGGSQVLATDTVLITSNTTIYAHWTVLASITVNVKFDASTVVAGQSVTVRVVRNVGGVLTSWSKSIKITSDHITNGTVVSFTLQNVGSGTYKISVIVPTKYTVNMVAVDTDEVGETINWTGSGGVQATGTKSVQETVTEDETCNIYISKTPGGFVGYASK